MAPPNRRQGQMAPPCVATAHSGANPPKSKPEHPLTQAGFFKSAQWSADGTSVLTHNEDNSLRTFILPQDLLTSSTPHHNLTPYTTIPSPEPIYATTPHPTFNLSDPTTTLLLSSLRDHPIRLHNVLDTTSPTTGGPPLAATYPLINTHTETYLTPHALLISPSAAHTFVAGSTSRLSIFDFTRPGEGPVASIPTIPSKRTKRVGGGVGMKGIISALGVSRDGLLAAGTLSRWVGLYDHDGAGGCVGVFPLTAGGGDAGPGGRRRANDELEGWRDEADGTGITSLDFSPDGTYLYIAERKSNSILVYDIRIQGRRLGVLRGRKAMTNQRMGFQVVSAAGSGFSSSSRFGDGDGDGDVSAQRDGHQIWAGGTDGYVRVWRNPYQISGEGEGVAEPDDEWHAHDDAIPSTNLHPLGAGVAATCSGSRQRPRSIAAQPISRSLTRRSSTKCGWTESRALSLGSSRHGSSGSSGGYSSGYSTRSTGSINSTDSVNHEPDSDSRSLSPSSALSPSKEEDSMDDAGILDSSERDTDRDTDPREVIPVEVDYSLKIWAL